MEHGKVIKSQWHALCLLPKFKSWQCVVRTKLMNKNNTMFTFFSWKIACFRGGKNSWICCHDLVASQCGLVAGNRFWPRASQWWADRQEAVGKKLWRNVDKTTTRVTTKDLQIIKKIELYRQTPSVSAWLKLWLRIDFVKMHIMASYILFWRGWYEEEKSRRVQFIVLQRGQFCNIMSMDCYPRWSISQNFPGNRTKLYSEGYHMRYGLNGVAPSECWKPLKKKFKLSFSYFQVLSYRNDGRTRLF